MEYNENYTRNVYASTWRKPNRRRKHLKRRRALSSNRYPGRNKHHLHPKCRGGDSSKQNLLLIDIEKHIAWHTLFKNKTAEEVLQLLQRVVRAKQHQKS